MQKILSIALILVFVTGCSSQQYNSSNRAYKRTNTITNSHNVIQTLNHQYKEWRGVSYLYGGTSKTGVDCSGFVYNVFRNGFDVFLPRTTKDQIKTGSRVANNRFKAGDLIFFRSAKKTRHVGIYVENGRFIHASTSKGVISSSLDSSYWSSRYWQARRIL